jgi:hypothetical protein
LKQSCCLFCENLAIPVTQPAIDELGSLIDTPREEGFRWVSDEFDTLALRVYEELGSLRMEALTGWAIFNVMAPLIREQVEADEVYDKLAPPRRRLLVSDNMPTVRAIRSSIGPKWPAVQLPRVKVKDKDA